MGQVRARELIFFFFFFFVISIPEDIVSANFNISTPHLQDLLVFHKICEAKEHDLENYYLQKLSKLLKIAFGHVAFKIRVIKA